MDNKINFQEPELINYEDQKFPELIYKYREGNNPIHKTVLSKKDLFYAAPKTFSDKSDCRNPDRFDLLTDDEILEKYKSDIKKYIPYLNDSDLNKQAQLWFNEKFLRNKKRLESLEIKEWHDFNKKIGVLSLTPVNDNYFMWKKYSANFNGFCVGFDSKILFKNVGGGGIVNYVNKLPTIHPLEKKMEKFAKKIFFKKIKYQDEKEYRLVKPFYFPPTDEQRKYQIENRCFKELIIGEKLSLKNRIELIKLTKKINTDIKIYIAKSINKSVVIEPYSLPQTKLA